jgi:hypothetical protein
VNDHRLGAVLLFAFFAAAPALVGCNVPASVTPAPDRGPPAVAEAPSSEPAEEPIEAPVVEPLQPFPGVAVDPVKGVVELAALVCLEGGWLEQVACMPGTREHEALVVVEARPRQVHAALLMAGAEPGAPGRWTFVDDVVQFIAPTGSKLDVSVRHDVDGVEQEVPIGRWIRDHLGRAVFPDEHWVFAGSRFTVDPHGREHYVADVSGSVIGLVTFGDEVVGFSKVLADQAAVQPPEWEVDTSRIPPVGTAVTVVLRLRAR